jgi:hypothetical protein
LPPIGVEATSGAEGYFRLAVPGTGGVASIDGWFSHLESAVMRPYAPSNLGRAGLVLHGLYSGGQLEPRLRIEGQYRGTALVPNVASAASTDWTDVSGHETLNLSVQIRIIDVEAFLIWNNLLENQSAIDIPGASVSIAKLIYGAKWEFRN